MIIKYMRESVDTACLMKAHKISIPTLNFLIRTAVDDEFTIDRNTYQLVQEDQEKVKKRSSYTVYKKGMKKRTGLALKDAAAIVRRSAQVLSTNTILDGKAFINHWYVEREDFKVC